ncbi:hypothetical protein AAHE18_11G134100 [Arachis hypogaea]
MNFYYLSLPTLSSPLLYIFYIHRLHFIHSSFFIVSLELSMSTCYCLSVGSWEPADPFATPLEILPEWYFFPVFHILRTVPNKLLGVLLMVSVPAGLLTVPFLENVNKFQNPFRRPVSTTIFLIGTAVALSNCV